MTGEQLQLAVLAAGGGIATLLGYGVLRIGPQTARTERMNQLFRKLGPTLLILCGILLALSFRG